MDQSKLDTIRIKFLCKFMDRGGGTLQELHAYVNRQLEEADSRPVGLRTLQALLEKLRKGHFNHSMHGYSRNKGQEIFKINYRNRIYSWAEDSSKPEFGDLDENERYTLPFLRGILKKYESIPAVSKILDSMPELFGITESEMDSASVVYHGGVELCNDSFHTGEYAGKVIGLAIKILGHINKCEMIEFLYVPVTLQDDQLSKTSYHGFVSPMQIRFYNEYYYLTAIAKDRIVNYRIDLISGLKVDVQTDEEGNSIYFDAKKLEKKFRINEHFKYVLGIWNHETDAQVYTINIRFKGWAASYVKKLKFHSTQKISDVDLVNATLTLSFQLKLGKEQYNGQPIEERSPELDFFLGRFGDSAEIISAVPR
jgi:hypothetical protein